MISPTNGNEKKNPGVVKTTVRTQHKCKQDK